MKCIILSALLVSVLPGLHAAESFQKQREDQFKLCASDARLFFVAANAKAAGRTREQITAEIKAKVAAELEEHGIKASDPEKKEWAVGLVVSTVFAQQNAGKSPTVIALDTLQGCLGND
ncbi:hypothetical protein [Dyella subtropica]|uniref:hypothetical protein n=1 Tax=Dyella subtropica TaxID=2992127 RepID=UPI00225A2D93|nr:hypothetical protein [Dyella subtropica]